MASSNVLLISPYFLPSNLAGVQRVRLMAGHLKDFGWNPIVLSVHSRHYEETCSADALKLSPPGLEIVYVDAISQKIARPLGIGDITLRAYWSLRKAIKEIVDGHHIDLVFSTVLPGYASLIGAWTKDIFDLPFVLDYQDPWVSDWGSAQPWLSKAGLSHRLATWLEPKAITKADAVTAVSADTLQTLKDRALLRSDLPIEIIPIGAEPQDHELAKQLGSSLIQKASDEFIVTYLGTITSLMLPSVKAFFAAIRKVINEESHKKIQVHFIGTSANSNEMEDTLGLYQMAVAAGIANCFHLETRRIPYLDALRTMQTSDLLLMLGSSEPHYTASKLFPYWLSQQPMLALFHKESTVNILAQELGHIQTINYDDKTPPHTCIPDLAKAIEQRINHLPSLTPTQNSLAFYPYSSQGIARRYATLFDTITASYQPLSSPRANSSPVFP